ncbi:MAG: hypothetical protein ACOY42_04150 [Pseudomonadota bacterium]|jgi:hypothetical protein
MACIALHRLPPRHIRHAVDLAFFPTEWEPVARPRAIDQAVACAFTLVRARRAAGIRDH